MKTLVLFHANCSDGFAAAWTARRILGDDAEYIPVQYGQEPPDVTGRDLFVLDFSFKRPVLLDMIAKAHSLVLLDHHVTARDDLAGLDTVLTGQQAKAPHIVFDMDRSGAHLAWNYFFPGKQCHWLVAMTEDRDLWRHRLPNSRAVNAALSSLPRDFAVWDALAAEPSHHALSRLIDEGTAILRYQDQLVKAICGTAREVEIDGHKILAANSSVLFSEVAGELAKFRPFGACWFTNEQGVRVWSLRSKPNGVDVSEVAKKHGGGGHRSASGFRETMS